MGKFFVGKKIGCFVLVAALLAAWIIGGALLYRAALNAPKDTEKSAPFSFIPDDEDESEEDEDSRNP